MTRRGEKRLKTKVARLRKILPVSIWRTNYGGKFRFITLPEDGG